MAEIAGGCLCGRVRYSASGEPVFAGICHCRDCQRFTGSAFAMVIGVPKGAVTLEGETRSFTKVGDSGKEIERRFCPGCGSSILDEAAMMPDVWMIASGTLDDASWVEPTMEIYCDSAQPWVALGGGMRRFGRGPG